ncbi:MAG: hypothetical protein DWQ02_18245 [Bacteroidetes bacterium]|nr:MAG: hypothetical protein DWQ02_18245 [Bacteroidota bacterium]
MTQEIKMVSGFFRIYNTNIFLIYLIFINISIGDNIIQKLIEFITLLTLTILPFLLEFLSLRFVIMHFRAPI